MPAPPTGSLVTPARPARVACSPSPRSGRSRSAPSRARCGAGAIRARSRAFAASALLTPLLVWRCARHPAPVLELACSAAARSRPATSGRCCSARASSGSCWRTRSTSRRSGATRCCAPAWRSRRGRSPARPRRSSRLATPTASTRAGSSSRARVISAAAAVWLATQVGPEPAFLVGVAAGAVRSWASASGSGFATIVAVCVRDLGPAQLGIGSGMSATTRQLGAVLGVAILIAILGPAPGPGAYDAGWWAMAALALLAVVPIALIGRRGADRGAAPPGRVRRPRRAIRRVSAAAVAGRSSPNAKRRPLRARTRSVATRRRGRRSVCSPPRSPRSGASGRGR